MIHAIIGVMKSSKTSILIGYTEMLTNEKYVILYPACCEKKEDYVLSRDRQRQARAIKVFDINDLYNYVEDNEYIFIDEFQFLVDKSNLDSLMDFLEYCDRKNKTVYLFGLPLDYTGTAFDVTQRILPYADTVITLNATCEICGNIATRCVRYVDGILDDGSSSDILLMEKNGVEYKSVCKKCYREITGLSAIK